MGVCRFVNQYGMVCGQKFTANGDLCYHHKQLVKMLEEQKRRIRTMFNGLYIVDIVCYCRSVNHGDNN